MPFLSDLLNSATQKATNFVQHPGQSLIDLANSVNERAKAQNAQEDAELQEFLRTKKLNGPIQMKGALELAQGYNPAGIFVPVDPKIAFSALKMEKTGISPKEIWNKLNVFRNPIDNQWRREITDETAKLKGGEKVEDAVMNQMRKLGKDKTAEPVTMGDIFHHPDLYEAYPHLKDIEVRFTPKDSKLSGRMALPEEGKGWFELNPNLSADKAKETILHELQHNIQENENWAVGGSSQDFHHQDAATKARDILNWRKEVESTAQRMGLSPSNNSDWYRIAHDKLIQDYYDQGVADWLPHEEARFQASWPAYSNGTDSRSQAEQLVKMYGLDKKTTPYNADQMYRRLGGEIEARQVGTRRSLNAEDRKQYFPAEYKSETNPYGMDTAPENALYLNRQGYFNAQDLPK